MPSRRNWTTNLAFLQVHLLVHAKDDVCVATQRFDTCRQMPVKFNPAGLGVSKQGAASSVSNNLSEGNTSLKSSG